MRIAARMMSWLAVALVPLFLLFARAASAETEPAPPDSSASADSTAPPTLAASTAKIVPIAPIASTSTTSVLPVASIASPAPSAVEVDAPKGKRGAEPSSSKPTQQKAEVEGIVRLKDRKVFSILVDREGHTATERARIATQALESAFDAKEGELRVERSGAVFTVYLGKAPIVDLDEADAEAAGAATLEGYVADVTVQFQSAIAQERKRSAIANTVFSFALVVFSALIAFLLLGKATQLASRAHDWVDDHPEKIPSLRVGGIELARAGAIEGFLTLGIDIGKRLVQLGVLYAWVIFSLSLFETTKGYTDKLTGLVIGPLSGFATRFGTALPLAAATAIAIFAIILLVRFTGVFFDGVVRGETTLDWVPQDLAAPVGVIVRLGIVVLGLIVSAPLLTGSDDGIIARAGIATLVAFGLAATPMLASGIVGSLVVFRRRLRPGDFVELAGRSGRVREVTLLEVSMEDDAGCAVRVPHLLSLVHPTRVMGRQAVVSVELVVDPKASQTRVRDVLLEAAAKQGAVPRIDLVALDVDGALYRVTLGVAPQTTIAMPPAKRLRSSSTRTVTRPSITPSAPPPPKFGVADDGSATTSVQLIALLADALAHAGIALGRRSSFESRAP